MAVLTEAHSSAQSVALAGDLLNREIEITSKCLVSYPQSRFKGSGVGTTAAAAAWKQALGTGHLE